jgi:hypothetical protein
MTHEQRKLAFELIANPPASSKLAEPKEYGIDLTLSLRESKAHADGAQIACRTPIGRPPISRETVKLQETFGVLYDARVEFVLIGGAAMQLQGSA